jgi:hypothetical protein
VRVRWKMMRRACRICRDHTHPAGTIQAGCPPKALELSRHTDLETGMTLNGQKRPMVPTGAAYGGWRTCSPRPGHRLSWWAVAADTLVITMVS